MQKPSGSNLEILAQLPSFFDELIKENTEMKARLKKLESQKESEKYDDSELKKAISALEKAVGGIKQYDGTDLKEQLADAVRLCKRDDSQYRSITEQLDIVKNECFKACKDAEYDDREVKESIKKLLGKVEEVKPYDDKNLVSKLNVIESSLSGIKPFNDAQIKKSLAELEKSVKSIKPFDDSLLKKQIAELSKALNCIKPYSDAWIKSELKKINESLSLLKNYDDKAIVSQIGKVSDRITFVENALGVK